MTTIRHHASEFTLADYANGRLDVGRRLVVETHLEHCAECRAYLGVLDQIGGKLLEEIPHVTLEKDALSKVFAKIDMSPAMEPVGKFVQTALSQAELGKWRRLGPRIQLRSVTLPDADKNIRTFILRAEGNTWLPRHSHSDLEWTCVLEGSFTHSGGTYGPGDFDEADDTMRHHPFVESGAACVCLVALKGNVVFESWIGRLIQPFVRL